MHNFYWLIYVLVFHKMIKKLGEGTFSEVFKAQDTKTGEFVAVKCMKKKYTNILLAWEIVVYLQTETKIHYLWEIL